MPLGGRGLARLRESTYVQVVDMYKYIISRGANLFVRALSIAELGKDVNLSRLQPMFRDPSEFQLRRFTCREVKTERLRAKPYMVYTKCNILARRLYFPQIELCVIPVYCWIITADK